MRLWLARKLAPEVFRDAERFAYLRRRMDDLSTWCGHEFPVIAKAADWALRSTRVHFMPIAEFNSLVQNGGYKDVAVGDISRFREDLRRERDAAAALSDGGQ